MAMNAKTGCLVLVLVLLFTILAGCSNNVVPEKAENGTPAQITALPTVNPDPVDEIISDKTDSPQQTDSSAVTGLSNTQLKAINTLNYLTSLLQDIHDSKQNRIYLQEAFALLKDNIHPDIDSITQSYITDILNTLSNLRMLAVKREHLEYIYEQNKARAIRAAIPNPLTVLSVVQAQNPIKTIASLAFMAVDSIGSYLSQTEAEDLKHLQDGWDLDEQEMKQLDNSQINAFNYMVNIIREADLHDNNALLALNERSVKEFIEIKNTSNLFSRIQALKDNEKTYAGYGGYWLLLAQSYYDLEQYENCLNALAAYESLNMDIFRKDHDYANTIPLMISTASETMPVNEYIPFAEKYLARLMDNCENSQWNLRYFAAISYLDLYMKSQNTAYLERAFYITKNNVNYLVKEQIDRNTSYLKAVEKIATKNLSEKNKKEAEQINKARETKRKTELPPVYEPLWINCTLLFSLAQQYDVPVNEKTEIEAILHGNKIPLFLVEPLDDVCWFDQKDHSNEATESIVFNKSDLSIPAKYLCDDYKIIVELKENNSTTEFDDWKVIKIERKKDTDIASFTVKLKSNKAASHKYADDGIATVSVFPKEGSEVPCFSATFMAVPDRAIGVKYNLHFERVEK